ncbi:MAG TPA: ribonuclease P protein component [Patescibacteria group bacterium]|nr:ribonuclease P protein component [Patescibacteria group bacterium]
MKEASRRALSGDEIRAIRKEGKKITSPLFLFYYLPDPRKEQVTKRHVAIVVSTHISKQAVYRNRTKRKIKEAIREFSFFPGYVGVLVAKKDLRNTPQQDVVNEIKRLHIRL